MRLLEEKDKQEYKKFLESHDRCNFQQSLEWGNIKSSWKKEVILSEDKDGKIRGSLCVWIRKFPIFGNMMYSARGPVCDLYDEEVIKDLKYLIDKSLITGVSINEIDNKLVYYSVEKHKKDGKVVYIDCPHCGALNEIPIGSKKRCEYCETIIEHKLEK